jgi:DNA polymerase-4
MELDAWPRVILHCDMDAFYAAIEQRDDPALRGKPVIVGGLGKRSVVSTASYEARKFGVHSAMPGARAHELCPHGIFVKPRMGVYAEESRKIRGVFETYTPLVEPLSLDEAFLDVTASRGLFGDGPAVARRVKEDVKRLTKLTVSIGVAASKYVAKVASDLHKPDGLTVVPPGTEAAFLAPLPVSRLWGAGRVTEARLARLGLRTIGDVQKLGLEELRAALGGSFGEHFHALSRGLDSRPVEPELDPKSIGRETTFEDDLTDDDACRAVLLELCESVGRRLRREGARARTVRVKIRFPPFETLTRQVKLERATRDDDEIYRAAASLFAAARAPGSPVRLLGVALADLTLGETATQHGLFEQPGRGASRDRLHNALDAIRDRFGEDAIRRGG